MTPEPNRSPQSERPRLHRSRQERVLFGVCGGIAEYLGIDPTIVRVAFVLGALMPPLSAQSLLGYPLLAIIMPVEEIVQFPHLPGQDRVRSNIEALRADAGDLAGQARGALSSITKRSQPPASEAAPSTESPATNGDALAMPQDTPPEIPAASGSTTGPAHAA